MRYNLAAVNAIMIEAATRCAARLRLKYDKFLRKNSDFSRTCAAFTFLYLFVSAGNIPGLYLLLFLLIEKRFQNG